MIVLIIIVVIVVLLIIVGAAMYNSLVRLNQQANEAWSDITVQLKRRADLIPNLVNTVKGYAAHEKTVFDNVTKARAETLGAQSPKEAAKAEGDFQKTMKSLFAVAENYPDLKASQNFQELQGELTDTEDKIQASRRFYNGVVRDFNTKRKTFPTNIFASMLGFKQDKEFFEVDEAESASIQNPVDVKF
ncbi:MAG TPA: LemA family protein [Candidatus Saccharimonadales bacterium]|nr:LemA family protein [Candidatus Saccharimonadales bacterium]